jgi:hypothetical protein
MITSNSSTVPGLATTPLTCYAYSGAAGRLSENEVMPHSFLQDRESEADWEPDALELPLVESWPRPLKPTTLEIDAPESERGSRVIIIDLT